MSYLKYNGQYITHNNSYLSGNHLPSKWFLPSLDELNAMYVNLKTEDIGNFTDEIYWNSTEYNSTRSFRQSFSTGVTANSIKNSLFSVRACRTFNAAEGQYSLGDQTPSGGWVFYIDGTTYYEAAPADLVSTYAWSDITSTAIGTTGTAIGDGITNTAAIITQGATSGAAVECDNYSVPV